MKSLEKKRRNVVVFSGISAQLLAHIFLRNWIPVTCFVLMTALELTSSSHWKTSSRKKQNVSSAQTLLYYERWPGEKTSACLKRLLAFHTVPFRFLSYFKFFFSSFRFLSFLLFNNFEIPDTFLLAWVLQFLFLYIHFS